jgi:hypothetical protein
LGTAAVLFAIAGSLIAPGLWRPAEAPTLAATGPSPAQAELLPALFQDPGQSAWQSPRFVRLRGTFAAGERPGSHDAPAPSAIPIPYLGHPREEFVP